MDYRKRTYAEVSKTFTHMVKSPDFSLLGVLHLSRKISMGINGKGIWLWYIAASESLSLKMFPDSCQFGFFEWEWIQDIYLSFSRRMAFILFHDLDSILQNVVLAEDIEAFKKAFVVGEQGKKVIQFPLTSDDHFPMFNHITSHKYTKVYTVE